MALLAESLVDEWLNRQKFFTMRGVKKQIDEIDLLAVRPIEPAGIEAWHIEVQVSFRPMKYLTSLTAEIAHELNKGRTSAVSRNRAQLEACALGWVEKKFKDPKKEQLREKIWLGLQWKYVMVHGVVKYPEELEVIAGDGVDLIPLSRVLSELCAGGFPLYTAAAGADLADLIRYYAETSDG